MPQNVLQDIDMAEAERAARARGYRNYAHMIDSMRRRLPPPKIPGATGGPGQGGGAWNFLQQLFTDPGAALQSAFSWHPSNTIGRAGSALRQANERNR